MIGVLLLASAISIGNLTSGSNNQIVGSWNHVNGEHNYVVGDRNRVIGNRNRLEGVSDYTVHGDGIQILSNEQIIVPRDFQAKPGVCHVSKGNDCLYPQGITGVAPSPEPSVVAPKPAPPSNAPLSPVVQPTPVPAPTRDVLLSPAVQPAPTVTGTRTIPVRPTRPVPVVRNRGR